MAYDANPVLPTAEILTEAFPKALSRTVEDVLPPLLDTIDCSYTLHRFEAVIAREAIKIPARIHFTRLPDLSGFPVEASVAVACLLSRSTDGHWRQAALRRVLATPEPWTLPFVFALMGEYVVEILEDIHTGLPKIDPAAIREFAAANGELMRLTRARIPSYWDAYYRHRWKKADYVGFRILGLIDGIIRTDKDPIPAAEAVLPAP